MELAGLRGLTIAEGVLLLVLGALALLFPVLASFWVTAVVAFAFLVGGIVGWINGLSRARGLGVGLTFWRLVVATLFLIAGISMIRPLAGGPLAGAGPVASLALAIGVVFLLEGILAVLVSLRHRHLRGWGWGLANGVVTLVLGLLILTMKFWNLLWVLGTLVGISFLFSGIDLLTLGVSLHRERDGALPGSGEA